MIMYRAVKQNKYVVTPASTVVTDMSNKHGQKQLKAMGAHTNERDVGYLACVLTCLLKPLDVEKQVPQSTHWYGFSPVCVLSCTVKVPFSEKRCPQ